MDIADAARISRYVFRPEHEPLACQEAAGLNGDSFADASDEVFFLNYLFLGGDAPPPPGPDSSGPDPEGGECLEYSPAPPPPPRLADFALGFECPAGIAGTPGVSAEVFLTLTTSNNTVGEGAEAWSVSIGAENLHITAVSTSVVSLLLDTGGPMCDGCGVVSSASEGPLGPQPR